MSVSIYLSVKYLSMTKSLRFFPIYHFDDDGGGGGSVVFLGSIIY
jgi:hypothetical protein